MFLPPRGKAKGYAAHQLFVVSVAHDVSSVRPGLRLFAFSAFRPADVSAFSAFRLFGFPGMEVKSVIGWRARLTVTLNPVCLTMKLNWH